MDFNAEVEKRKQQYIRQIGQLAYERCGLSKQVESCQKRIAEIDELVAERECRLEECDQSQRDFGSYLAVKESAITLAQLENAIAPGADLETPEPEK